MSDDPILSKILADPGNDQPRLEWAKSLEQQGDPRGEFVRLQCRLEKLDPDSDEYFQASVRAAELLAEHGDNWIGNDAFLGDVEFEFRRGLPHKASLDSELFASLAEQLRTKCPTVRHLDLTWGERSDWKQSAALEVFETLDVEGDGIEGCPHVFQLKSLTSDATVDEVVGVAKQYSKSFDRLEHLGLQNEEHDNLKDLAKADSADCFPVLKSIDVSAELNGPPPGDGWLSRLLGKLFGLERVSMNKVRGLSAVVECKPSALTRWATRDDWTQLKSLSLSHYSNDGPPDEDLATWGRRGQLETLRLDGFSRKAIAGFETAADFKAVRELALRSCGLQDSDLARLANAPLFQGVRHLDLTANEIEDAGVQALAEAQGLAALQHLNLRLNSIGDGLKHLARSPLLHRLTEVHLAGGLTDDSLREFLESPAAEYLRKFELCACEVTAAGLPASGLFSHLEELCATETPLNDEGWLALGRPESAPLLQSLDLSYNEFSPEVFEQPVNFPRLKHLNLDDVKIGPHALTLLQHSRFPALVSLSVRDCGIEPDIAEQLRDHPSLPRLKGLYV
jgi:uncharacterized protein (TIGR02996 family)